MDQVAEDKLKTHLHHLVHTSSPNSPCVLIHSAAPQPLSHQTRRAFAASAPRSFGSTGILARARIQRPDANTQAKDCPCYQIYWACVRGIHWALAASAPLNFS